MLQNISDIGNILSKELIILLPGAWYIRSQANSLFWQGNNFDI